MTRAATVITTVLTASDSFGARRSASELLEDTPSLRSGVERVGEPGQPILFTVVPDVTGERADEAPCGTVYWSESMVAGGVVGVLGVAVDEDTAVAATKSVEGRWTRLVPDDAGRAAAPARLGTVAPGENWDVTELLSGAADAVAVQDGADVLSYGELREAAERVAARVIDTGTTGRVLLRGRRDVRTVAAMLGCWLAGTAWGAVDTTAPQARRAAIEFDVRPDLVLDTADVELEGAPVAAKRERPEEMDAEAVAYLVATSGSTGRPKVSALPAGGLRPLLRAWRGEYGFTSPQRVCQIGSLEGDVFIGDMLKA